MLDLYARVRLLFAKDKDFRAELAGILGFLPIHIEYYKIAFSHSSNQYRSPKGGRKLNNERLEFLGDAILEAVVSDLVFHHFENKREGFLTNTRSKIVQRSMLNELATEMGVDRLIRTSMREQAHNSNIGGNAFEALIGAIYLDRGYAACKKFVKKQILRKFVNIDDVANKEVNFKSKVLEYCQKNRITPEFKLKNKDTHDPNSPTFRSILDIEGIMVGEGKGYSKKESEQNACRDALLRLRRSQALVNQVFEAKEKRTSTEAPIFVAVPKIDEIEEEIAKMSDAKSERRRQQRTRQKERREAASAVSTNEAPKAESKEQKSPAKPAKKQDVVAEKSPASAKDKEKKTREGQTEKRNEPSLKAVKETAEDSPTKSKNARNARRRKNTNKETPVANQQPAETQPEATKDTPAEEPKQQPAPLFLLRDLPTQAENSQPSDVPSEKPVPQSSRSTKSQQRKPKAEPDAQVEQDVEQKEEVRSAEQTPESVEEKSPRKASDDAPAENSEKKPRRNSRRRRSTPKKGKEAAEETPTTSESAPPPIPTVNDVPTLPFAPQE